VRNVSARNIQSVRNIPVLTIQSVRIFQHKINISRDIPVQINVGSNIPAQNMQSVRAFQHKLFTQREREREREGNGEGEGRKGNGRGREGGRKGKKGKGEGTEGKGKGKGKGEKGGANQCLTVHLCQYLCRMHSTVRSSSVGYISAVRSKFHKFYICNSTSIFTSNAQCGKIDVSKVYWTGTSSSARNILPLWNISY
jgi:hypothetical protein